ncbi:MAG: 4Fe-4S binding protein [Candidatus Riflebacteria bacterium]|nr:4Fe-4S binding protein [Candidatus Riflebacteria bacterium]
MLRNKYFHIFVQVVLVLLFIVVMNPKFLIVDLSEKFLCPNWFTVLEFLLMFSVVIYGTKDISKIFGMFFTRLRKVEIGSADEAKKRDTTFRFFFAAGIIFFTCAVHSVKAHRALDTFIALQDSIVAILTTHINGLHLIPVVIVAGVLLAVFFFGNIFCGWICPFGVFHEFLFIRKISIPISARVDKILSWGRFPALVLFIAVAVKTGKDPFLKLFSTISELTEFKGVILWEVFFLLLAFVILRPFCRYLCPVGGLLSIVSSIGFFRIKLDQGCCKCSLATKECPVGAITCPAPSMESPVLEFDSLRCISCGACINSCKKNALK